jgi:hypothetical protein
LSFASAQIPGVIYQERCVIDGGGERMLQKYFTPSRLMTFSAQRAASQMMANDGACCAVCVAAKNMQNASRNHFVPIRALGAFC